MRRTCSGHENVGFSGVSPQVGNSCVHNRHSSIGIGPFQSQQVGERPPYCQAPAHDYYMSTCYRNVVFHQECLNPGRSASQWSIHPLNKSP